MKNKLISIFIISFLSSEFSSCAQSASSKSNMAEIFALAFRAARVIADSRDNVVLQGNVNGPGSIKNALIQVFPTPANGQCAKEDGTINGTPIATAISDDLGYYSVKYKKTGSTLCVVVSPTGSSQVQVFSPTARANVPTSWSKGNLMAVINEPTNSSNAGFTAANKTVNVNPFTRMAARRFSALSAINPASRSRVFLRVIPFAERGASSSERAPAAEGNKKVEFGNNTASTLLDKASEDVENAFFPNRDKKTFSLESADPESNAMKLKLGSIAITANKVGGGSASSDTLESVVNFMEEDFSDGRFDGKKVDEGTGKIATMNSTDFGGVVTSKQAADDFLKKDFKSAQAEYDTLDSSLTSAASDQLFCETDSLDAACSIAVLPGSPPEAWVFDDIEDFVDIGGISDMGGVGYGTYGSQKTWYFTIVNGGGSDLKLTLPITITGTQFVVTEQPDEIVASGDATYFTVEFTPTSIATFTQTMTITSNDTLYSPYTITFTGNGQDLDTNIALQWSFDESDATDYSPSGCDGTLSDPTLTEDRLEYEDVAFYFDSDYPDEITSSCTMGAGGATSLTISAWVAPDYLENGNNTIMNRGIAATPDFTLAFTNNGTNIEFTTRTTTSATLNYAIDPDDYQDYWTHVAAVFNGSQMTLYIDGVQVAQTTRTSGTVVNSSNFTVGSKDSTTDFFSGTLDEIRVYERGLTASQISALMNQD